MTQLSKQAIKEFQEIAKSEQGLEIPYDEARSIASEWLGLFSLIARFKTEVNGGKEKQSEITPTDHH